MDFEPVASFAKQNALSVITLAVVLYFGNDLGDDIDSLRADIARNGAKIDDLRQQMYEEHTDLRASIAGLGERLVRVETIMGVLQATVGKPETAIPVNTPEPGE